MTNNSCSGTTGLSNRSKDNTYSVAEEYSKRHDNIVLIKNECNKGLNFTLNHCLKYANTKYVARMDGDDISMPTRFEKQVAFLDSHPDYVIVSSSMIYFDENGDFRTGKAKKAPTKYDFVRGTPFCHAPSMVRKSAYDAVGGYSVDKRLLRVEDYHLWFKMYSKGLKGWNIDEPLYKMRDDRNAIARRTFQNRLNEMHVKLLGFKMLGLPWYYKFSAITPLLKHIVPKIVYVHLHRMKR